MQTNNRDEKAGQATTDFLLSYGLAILVVVLVAALLFALGVFDASNFVGTKSAGFAGVAVKGWSMDSSGLFTLQLTNHVGQMINITGVSIAVDAANTSVNSTVGTLPISADTGVLSTNASAFGARTPGSGYIASVMINYIDMSTGFASTAKGTLTGRVASGPALICPQPSASPAPGAYTSAQSVALSAGACSTIRYTVDGSVPTNSSAVYSGAISAPIDANTTIKAFSSGSGYSSSAIFSGTYAITHILSTPAASPPAGSYNSTKNVTLTAENGSTIYYTIDGSTPTQGSAVYASPISVPAGANTTIKAYSVKTGYGDSPIFSGTYIIASLPSPAPNSTLVLQMDFDHDVGAIAVDSSVYGNNGTIVNASHVSGISGSALKFNGTGYVVVPSSASLNVGNNMSVEAWIRWGINPYAWASSGYGWANIISKGEDNQWRLQHSSNNGLFEFGVSSSAWVQSTTSPEQGHWYHVVGVANSTHISIYVDGNREATNPYNGLVPFSTWDLNIGRRGAVSNDRQFNGTIDSVRLYNRTLTASEIEADYNSGEPPG